MAVRQTELPLIKRGLRRTFRWHISEALIRMARKMIFMVRALADHTRYSRST
jgi:hypothetical protein